MAQAPLLVFDFDGVLVDGMPEYWWSARRSALTLRPELSLPEQAPPGFALLRPLIHKGWEMVLSALELSRSDLNLATYLADYDGQINAALERWQLRPEQLQHSLETLRSEAIQHNLNDWLALHRLLPWCAGTAAAAQSRPDPLAGAHHQGGRLRQDPPAGPRPRARGGVRP